MFKQLNEAVSIILIVAALVAAAGYVAVKFIKPDICADDGFLEEIIIEPALETALGAPSGSIDLTPATPEK